MYNQADFLVKRNNNYYLDASMYQVLSLLYKPVIGIDAFDLYVTLYNFCANTLSFSKPLSFLSDILSYDRKTPLEIDKSIEILEKVKLIKADHYDFELYPPYSGYEYFITDLAFVLKNNVSIKQFEYLSKLYNKKNIKIDYTDKSIDNIKLKYREYKHMNVSFSLDELIQASHESNSYQSEEDYIYMDHMAKVYELTLNEALTILFETTVDSEKMDRYEANKKAYNKYTQKKILSKLVIDNTSDDSIVEFFEKTSPETFLKNSDIKMTASIKNTITKLRTLDNLPDEIITVLFAYSLSTKNELRPYNLFNKMAVDWRKNGVKTARDAFYYINNYLEKAKETKNYKEETMSPEEMLNDYWDRVKRGETDGF